MKIFFLADNTYNGILPFEFNNYLETKTAIEKPETNIAIVNYGCIVTTQLCFLSFDLLEKFEDIVLIYKGVFYDIKLGSNSWTSKHLRKQHNLFKLVQSYILNN